MKLMLNEETKIEMAFKSIIGCIRVYFKLFHHFQQVRVWV